jgi:hypothetical protein
MLSLILDNEPLLLSLTALNLLLLLIIRPIFTILIFPVLHHICASLYSIANILLPFSLIDCLVLLLFLAVLVLLLRPVLRPILNNLIYPILRDIRTTLNSIATTLLSLTSSETPTTSHWDHQASRSRNSEWERSLPGPDVKAAQWVSPAAGRGSRLVNAQYPQRFS